MNHDCLIIDVPHRKYRYLVDLDIDRKAEVEVWFEDDATDPLHIKFTCFPRKGLFSRLRDAILTLRGFDTVYVVNMSPRVLEAIKEEVSGA